MHTHGPRRPLPLRRLCIALALVALAGSPAAQVTEKQAASALKALQKGSLKTMKAEVTAASKVFDLQLGVFEDAVAAGGFDVDLLAGLFANAQAMQAAIVGTITSVGTSTWIDASLILNDLGEVAPLDGHFPKDFYLGTGGSMDGYAKAVDALLDKVFEKLGKRVAKAVKLADKHGIALSLRLRPPVGLIDAAIAEGALALGNTQALTIDIAMGGGRLDVDGDNSLFLGGSGDLVNNSVTVLLNGADVGSQSVPVTGAAHRWTAEYVASGSGLPEGNYITRAFSNNVGAPTSLLVGLR